jgi:hypothetical protein
MAMAELELSVSRAPRYRPWLQRRIEASGLPLAAAGVAIAALQLLAFFGWMALGWGLGVGSADDAWFWREMVGPNVIMAALIGWAPVAMTWSHRRAAAELTELAPGLGADASRLRERFETFPRWPMALSGALLAALVLPIVRFDPGMRAGFEQASGFGRAWMLVVNAEVGWLLTRAVLEDLRVARIFRDAGLRFAPSDLLDLAPLQPFARRAAEGVLLGAVSAALLSLIFAGEGWASTTLPFLVGLILAPTAVALALPLLGVHQRIREVKREELAWIHAAVRTERAAFQAGGPGTRLSALLALRAQVADVREWPLDLPALARLVGFLAIGLASWVGAALVDVGLERVLR